MLLGVDVGGTFTDAVLLDEGRIHTAKTPTTAADQSIGVIAAIDQVLAEAVRAAADVDVFAHGMTVGTNALLEERGARTALITTRGFADLLEIGRQDRPDLYRLCAPKPTPLIGAELRFEAAERIGPAGVARAARPELSRRASPRRSAQPGRVGGDLPALLLSRPDPRAAPRRPPAPSASPSSTSPPPTRSCPASASTSAARRRRSTPTSRPCSAATWVDWPRAAAEAGLPEPLVMQSSGGVAPAEEAARAAPGASSPGRRAARSAPDLLARVSAARQRDRPRHGRHLLRRLRGRGRRGAAHRLTDDRRAPAAAADGRRPHGRRRRRLDRLARPRAARCGSGRARRAPSPARPAIGRGGRSRRSPTPTSCSASSPPTRDWRAVSSSTPSAARAGVGALAASLGLGELETAEGIVAIANQEMVRALRVVTVERGLDPRGFALLPFGGAGPMHAAAIAAELGIERLICPRAGGVLSALASAPPTAAATPPAP